MSFAPLLSARAMCTVASYFAWIGQIGMQLLLPQHGGRSSRTTEFRPCGVERTSYGVPSNALPIVRSRNVCGISGIGYGDERDDPKSAAESPATPISRSAAPYQGSIVA